MNASRTLVLSLAMLAALPLAHADRGGGGRDGGERDGGRLEFRGGDRDGWRLDDRVHPNRSYPARGYYAPALPLGSLSITFGSGRFFFNSGTWYRPVGPRYLVVSPPHGIVVPMRPPDAVVLNGDAPSVSPAAPLYYANGVYYAALPDGSYQVVAPPTNLDGLHGRPAGGGVVTSAPAPVPVPAPAATRVVPVVYPRDGQSGQQTEADRQDCNRWATTVPSALADADVFQRAVVACMDARGYTLK